MYGGGFQEPPRNCQHRPYAWSRNLNGTFFKKKLRVNDYRVGVLRRRQSGTKGKCREDSVVYRLAIIERAGVGKILMENSCADARCLRYTIVLNLSY